jgi:hypothetical protein
MRILLLLSLLHVCLSISSTELFGKKPESWTEDEVEATLTGDDVAGGDFFAELDNAPVESSSSSPSPRASRPVKDEDDGPQRRDTMAGGRRVEEWTGEDESVSSVLPQYKSVESKITVNSCSKVPLPQLARCLDLLRGKDQLALDCSNIQGEVKVRPTPLRAGSKSVVYRGLWTNGNEKTHVIVKVPQIDADTDMKALRSDPVSQTVVGQWAREVIALSALRGRFAPRLFGVCLDVDMVGSGIASHTPLVSIMEMGIPLKEVREETEGRGFTVEERTDLAMGLARMLEFWATAAPHAPLVHCSMTLDHLALSTGALVPMVMDAADLMPGPVGRDEHCSASKGHNSCEDLCYRGSHYGVLRSKPLAERTCGSDGHCTGYDAQYNVFTVGAYLLSELFIADNPETGMPRIPPLWREPGSLPPAAEREFYSLIESIVDRCTQKNPGTRPTARSIRLLIEDFQARYSLKTIWHDHDDGKNSEPALLLRSSKTSKADQEAAIELAAIIERQRFRPRETADVFSTISHLLHPIQVSAWPAKVRKEGDALRASRKTNRAAHAQLKHGSATFGGGKDPELLPSVLRDEGKDGKASHKPKSTPSPPKARPTPKPTTIASGVRGAAARKNAEIAEEVERYRLHDKATGLQLPAFAYEVGGLRYQEAVVAVNNREGL